MSYVCISPHDAVLSGADPRSQQFVYRSRILQFVCLMRVAQHELKAQHRWEYRHVSDRDIRSAMNKRTGARKAFGMLKREYVDNQRTLRRMKVFDF